MRKYRGAAFLNCRFIKQLIVDASFTRTVSPRGTVRPTLHLEAGLRLDQIKNLQLYPTACGV